ncbi:MAG TPA: FxSxx-COOH system tetratricopeptide repeat protein [Actinocrinis sp.]|nr:FxSxx-COOH system tetratricopeptide repeat protein [Actinocrinis sp.]
MAEPRDGKIVTFYSFKGGTGRTMALANVAWILAANGKRVLTVDWDLESPGLARYFGPFLSDAAVRHTPGVIDLILGFEVEASRRLRRATKGKLEAFDDAAEYAHIQPFALSAKWDQFPAGGSLDFMPHGLQNLDYATTIGAFPWEKFWENMAGGRLVNALRAEMKAQYDYVLVDSRTGFSDISSICTEHLPDVLVNCFTLNTQGIEGALHMSERVGKFRLSDSRERIRVLPVPMRVENAEKEKADIGRTLARRRFDNLPADLAAHERERYWTEVEIPYQPFYAYEETLATFGDSAAGPSTLLGAYQRLTAHITDGEVVSMPPMEPLLRERWLKRFKRGVVGDVSNVVLDYEPADEAWAEWIKKVLAEVDVTVTDLDKAPEQPGGARSVLLTVVSSPTAVQAKSARGRANDPNHRVIYVGDMRPLDRLPASRSEVLTGLSAAEAADSLTRLLGCGSLSAEAVRELGDYYPGDEPVINNAPARNADFTGRSGALRSLREQLQTNRVVAVVPETLRRGVGKTQLVMEYAHRYRSAYDFIWWVHSGQATFIDTKLTDLGDALTEHFKMPVVPGTAGSAEEQAVALMTALGQGKPVRRWLLVFDDTENLSEIERFIPKGALGHIIITSRNRDWPASVATLSVDVFDRSESIAHLVRRASRVSVADADRLASALGDLPLAVSLTGAWLNETGAPVAEHIKRLEQHGPTELPGEDALTDYPDLTDYPHSLVAVLDYSLEQVRNVSPAARRLFELCAFMSGESIALGLIYSQPMVALLRPFDPTLAEPTDPAKHVRQLNRLAMIKFDTHANQLQVHRLLQGRVRMQLADEDRDVIRHQVHALLAANKPRRDVDDPDTWSRYRMIWPHLEPSDAADCHDESVRALMIDRVRYMWLRGPLLPAAATARTIEGQWEEHLQRLPAEEDDKTLRKQLLHLRFNLANILREQTRYKEAWKIDSDVRDQQRELLGAEHRHTLMTSSGLAADMRALGQYGQAAKLAEETYGSWLQEYGEEFPRTLDAANNLAISYRLVGRVEDARELDEATYERRRRALGELHPRTLSSASAIGRDMREAGRYSDSVDWLTELLEDAAKQREPHPRTIAEIEVNLASSLRAAGRYAAATPYIDSAYSKLRELYDRDQADVLICRLCRASNLLAGDALEEADKELRAVISSYRRLVGPENPITLVAISNHVAVLRSRGAYDEALGTAQDTAEQLRNNLGPVYPYTLAADMNVATCLADVGNLEESRSQDRRNVSATAELLGANHPDALRAAANLELTRTALNESGAQIRLAQIIERLATLIGREHPSVIALRAGNRNHRVLDPQSF